MKCKLSVVELLESVVFPSGREFIACSLRLARLVRCFFHFCWNKSFYFASRRYISFIIYYYSLPSRRWQRIRHKTVGSMTENNASAGAFYISVHFFAVPCKTTTSNNKIINFVEKTNTRRLIFLSLAIRTKLAPGQSSHIIQTKQTGTTVK